MVNSSKSLSDNNSKLAPVQRPMIDLFAGCGGLSLGFEKAGFTTVFVNELNDDARQTYLNNRTHLIGGEPFNSLDYLASSDVADLDTKRLEKLENDLKKLSTNIEFGENGNIDVLAGGPPCQGFSGIGHRRSYSVDKVQLPSNKLYERMAFVIEKVQPRIFLFENVRGLLSSKWTSSGEKGEIWDDVHKRFCKIGKDFGYVIKWDIVFASNYGVPQNRPRVLLVGMRQDVVEGSQNILDVEASENSALKCNFLPRHGLYNVPDLIDLFEDLEDPKILEALKKQIFFKPFSTEKYISPAKTKLQKLFRNGSLGRRGANLSDQEYSRHASRIVEKFQYMIETGGIIPDEFKTKKFAQKVLPKRWGNRGPSITATSLPDDYVHYNQPRSLTVREWARLQTFPDNYQFSGKRTTGGLRRAGNPRLGVFDREVPKYTQIGNAVPVWLAEAVGVHFDKILSNSGF